MRPPCSSFRVFWIPSKGVVWSSAMEACKVNTFLPSLRTASIPGKFIYFHGRFSRAVHGTRRQLTKLSLTCHLLTDTIKWTSSEAQWRSSFFQAWMRLNWRFTPSSLKHLIPISNRLKPAGGLELGGVRLNYFQRIELELLVNEWNDNFLIKFPWTSGFTLKNNFETSCLARLDFGPSNMRTALTWALGTYDNP